MMISLHVGAGQGTMTCLLGREEMMTTKICLDAGLLGLATTMTSRQDVLARAMRRKRSLLEDQGMMTYPRGAARGLGTRKIFRRADLGRVMTRKIFRRADLGRVMIMKRSCRRENRGTIGRLETVPGTRMKRIYHLGGREATILQRGDLVRGMTTRRTYRRGDRAIMTFRLAGRARGTRSPRWRICLRGNLEAAISRREKRATMKICPQDVLGMRPRAAGALLMTMMFFPHAIGTARRRARASPMTIWPTGHLVATVCAV